MSDAAPPVRSNSIYALLLLVVAFAAGPLLVYSREKDTAAMTATATETGTSVGIIAAEPPQATLSTIDSQAAEPAPEAEARTELGTESVDGIITSTEPILVARAITPTRLDDDLAALDARPTERGYLVTLSEVELRFPVGRSALASERPDGLRAIADVLARQVGLIVRIEGHTDRSGSASSNLALSQARARAVSDALVAMGIDADRIQTDGLGETRPLTDNQSAEARRLNRRVEIYLMAP